MTSPTARTLDYLRKQDITADVSERWISFGPPSAKPVKGKPSGVRKDLFGFIDVVYLDETAGQIVGVQCCAGSGHAARRTKIMEECQEKAELWVRCGGRIEVWSWRKLKVKRGGKAVRWTPRVEVIE